MSHLKKPRQRNSLYRKYMDTSSNQIYTEILKDTFTLHILNKRVRILKDFFDSKLFNSKPTYPYNLSNTDKLWLEEVSNKISPFINRETSASIFSGLDKKLQTLTPLLIYISFELPDIEIPKLGYYLRKDYGNEFLFDIKVDTTLLGGCSFVWNGSQKDYSLKKTIEDKKEDILEDIRVFTKR